MKKRKIFALLLICAMVLSGIGGWTRARAAEESGDIFAAPGTRTLYPMVAGGTTHFKIPVRKADVLYISSDIHVSVTTDNKIFDMTEGKLTRDDMDVKDIGGSSETYVEFDLTLNETAKIGTYDAKITFQFTGTRVSEYGDYTTVTSAVLPFQIRVIGEKSPAQLTVANLSYDAGAAAVGSAFEVEFDTKNEGEIGAVNAFMSVDFGDSGIVADYSAPTMKLGDIPAMGVKHHKLSFRVLPTASTGLKSVTVTYKYKDADGNEYTNTSVQYINVVAVNTAESNNAKLTAAAGQLNAEVNVDSSCNLTIELENIGKRTAENIRVLIPEEGGIGASSGILPEYGAEGVSVEYLNAGEKTTVTLPLSITKSAATGLRELTVQVDYEDSEGKQLTAVAKAYLTVTQPDTKPEIKNDVVISQMTQSPAQPRAGEVLTVSFVVTNNGSNDISGLQLYGEELSSNGFEPMSADAREMVGTLKKGESKEVTLQFRVGSNIPEGMNELHLAASYIDANGTQQKETTKVYILNVKKVTEEQLKNDIVISDIVQSPSSPLVGENVTVTFNVTNRGTKEISELKFAGSNLGTSGFEPISSEVFTTVGTVAAGASKKVSMTFKLGERISEGFNMLTLDYTYKDGNGDVQKEQTSMYVLNVKNQSSSANSRPKLIIDSFASSTEELRAGESFDFTFALKNTHASKAAKNITVTVMQAQDVFSATTGSNSFYIDAIDPGSTVEKTINLKVKSDTATGAYDLTIKVSYEYEDMSQADLQAGGASEDLPIKLQAVENSRPAVQNLSVGYYWDTPTVNQATTMTFDFYNMGRSSLNNVYVSLEGDFQMESGKTVIIGTVSAGSSSYQEISILPLVEGMANGKLIVHFEDSNGDEVTKEFDLPETYVQGEPQMPDWSGDNYNPGGDVSVGGNEIVEAKKPLMPVWAYALSLAGALVVGLLVTRGIVISSYKKKHGGADED